MKSTGRSAWTWEPDDPILIYYLRTGRAIPSKPPNNYVSDVFEGAFQGGYGVR